MEPSSTKMISKGRPMAVRVRISRSPSSRRLSSSLNTGMTTEISGAGAGSLTGRICVDMAPYLLIPDEGLRQPIPLRQAARDGRLHRLLGENSGAGLRARHYPGLVVEAHLDRLRISRAHPTKDYF